MLRTLPKLEMEGKHLTRVFQMSRRSLEKGKMCGTKCCDSFQCLEEEGESDFEPIGNPSLEEREDNARDG